MNIYCILFAIASLDFHSSCVWSAAHRVAAIHHVSMVKIACEIAANDAQTAFPRFSVHFLSLRIGSISREIKYQLFLCKLLIQIHYYSICFIGT